MIQLHIKGILLDQITGEPQVVLSTADDSYSFPINIGPSEANAIIIALEGIKPPRPLTHDLMIRFLTKHGFKIQALEIYAFIENKYYSRLLYKKGLRHYTMEIRPSDGLALVVRLGIPVRLHKGLLVMHPSLRLFVNNKIIYKDCPSLNSNFTRE
ncbi:MAG: bifunctional nuclease family protein [Spirochaetales bacterium]|nr:bifunctional nuclease family protein [Spirochaetales bacterium]